MIIRFLYLHKTKRQTVHEQSYVRAKFILPILASKFSSEVEDIVLDVFKVNQLYRRNRFETIIKASPQIIVVQFLFYILEHL